MADVKHEEVYRKAYPDVLEAQKGRAGFFRLYNDQRSHQVLGYRTPAEVFQGELGVADEASNGGMCSAGTGPGLLTGAQGLSLNSALNLSK